MLDVFKSWFHRYFSDQEAVVLTVLLVVGLVVILTMGVMLAPALAALVLAFLLQGLVALLEKYKIPHTLAVTIVFILFVAALTLICFVLLPLIWDQITGLVNELPSMIKGVRQELLLLPEKYPEIVSEAQVNLWISSASKHLADMGQTVLSFSLSQLPNFVGILIYLILVPILVFFFLKDKEVLLNWVTAFLPSERPLIERVSEEMNEQIANYVRGKVIEILIVGAVTYIAFAFLNVNYAALLGLLVGLSVIVPYIGAAVVTIPVALIGFFQWGWGNDFIILMVVYGVIQALDGNVLVPLLFSEAVNLHPVAIIVAVLVFGGLWGFWGIFFAIPLATLLKALLSAWPRASDGGGGTSASEG
ncbi:AI-2E family transporter [Zooshikella marina]|uniref:AI-2E family transporter n=1 Tax=Zooshikella ganghwensis TaxID=202772 RepID=A0A4P9VKQ9_9GAMM|nr:AI-2E family transporter [Zooshikella ganghwensis]MBU2704672.1 AI-2E family transporter [Zooshikella ganghwensis]RDH43109.1 AI-2E family transporter [Zooshikella ganghwensis]